MDEDIEIDMIVEGSADASGYCLRFSFVIRPNADNKTMQIAVFRVELGLRLVLGLNYDKD